MSIRNQLTVTGYLAGAALAGNLVVFLLKPGAVTVLHAVMVTVMSVLSLVTIAICVISIQGIDRRRALEIATAMMHDSPPPYTTNMNIFTLEDQRFKSAKPQKSHPKTRYQIAKAAARRRV